MQQPARLPLWFMVAVPAMILVSFLLGVFLERNQSAGLPRSQLQALQLVHDTLLRTHIDPQDSAHLLERAIAGMAAGLDPYTQYVPPAERARFDESNSGVYSGIGVQLRHHGGELIVLFPLQGGPSEQAGLLPGDRILGIDGHRFTSETGEQRQEYAHGRLREGPDGMDVTLHLRRGEGEPFDCVVRRGQVQKASVKWARLLDAGQRLGYIYVSDFHRNTAAELRGALDELQQDTGGPLRGLVLDLRYNGGGLLDQCVDATNLFLREGNILTVESRDPKFAQRHDAVPDHCLHGDLSLVLLVNRGSASASEVMTGALQDHGRATVVGARTYGKGMVNNVTSWPDLGFKLKVTTGIYRTPKGRTIEGEHHRRIDHHFKHAQGWMHLTETTTIAEDAPTGGLVPDVEVASDRETESALYAVLTQIAEPPRRHREAAAAVARAIGQELAQPPAPDRDPQLAAALAALRKQTGEDR